MDIGSAEGLLVLNKAVVFDVAGMLSLAGLLLWIYNINLDRRWLGRLSLRLFLVGAFISSAVWLVELHYDSLIASHQQSCP